MNGETHNVKMTNGEVFARLVRDAKPIYGWLLLGALMATAFFGMDVLLAVSPFLLIPEGVLIAISFFKKAPS